MVAPESSSDGPLCPSHLASKTPIWSSLEMGWLGFSVPRTSCDASVWAEILGVIVHYECVRGLRQVRDAFIGQQIIGEQLDTWKPSFRTSTLLWWACYSWAEGNLSQVAGIINYSRKWWNWAVTTENLYPSSRLLGLYGTNSWWLRRSWHHSDKLLLGLGT